MESWQPAETILGLYFYAHRVSRAFVWCSGVVVQLWQICRIAEARCFDIKECILEKSDRISSLAGYESAEVSLVDLAKIVIKWRKLELAIWALFFFAGLAYVLSTPSSFEFSSVYQVAMNGDKPLEVPEGLLSKIKNFYEPEVYQQLSKDSVESPASGIKLNISSPDSSALVVIRSVAPKSNIKDVQLLHQQLVKMIDEEQSRLLTLKQNALKAQLKTLEEQLKVLRQGDGQGLAAAILSTVGEKNKIQQTLTNLSGGNTLVLAQPSRKPIGPKRTLVLVVSLLLGAFVALLAGFGAEFVALVKASYSE